MPHSLGLQVFGRHEPPSDIEQTRQLHHPTLGLHCIRKNTPTPSRIPGPELGRSNIFASYLEKACRLLPADRDLSDTMSMRFPRAPATEAA